ncbi:M1 family metallopeptidase [Sphingomonas jaspsi]|uniref:M1 family metallopeptidase n=1 Tax=Sphingomonas jaspsi TaxID=392409 RepID=UPI0004AFD5A6|nr:M1 family metallopeptidase [Sphingomonas jaspsi]
MSHRLLAIGLSAILLLSCKAAEDPGQPGAEVAGVAPILDAPDAVDIHSFAKPLEARVTHVALDLAVDFKTKRIGGTATLDIDAKPTAKEIILDDRGLEIEAVSDQDGKPLAYKVGTVDPNLGAPLTIAIKDTSKIAIRYKAPADSDALQWLDPAQTAGKKFPFLLSQGESIANRSWIPTQDSPGIRQSWEAKISVAKPLTVVMSAPRAADPVDNGDTRTFSFRMDKPVAPYLIAIAAGDLAFRDLGPRTGVWAEPVTLDAAAKELEDTEKMVSAAEALYGPYAWGRYDMLVLPPSFPFGGMENPTLTFLTPTFIAGDKSLTSLIAHELAHSWSGNLATNATWSDFWLNEGMTTYAERRIVESVYGPKVAAQQVALGVDAMNSAIEDNGGLNGADTRLHIDLSGRHPDDGLTDIAYEKGATFLRTIESIVGRAAFDEWLKGWFKRHQFQPVTTSIFLADIRQYLVKGDQSLEQRLMLDDWVGKPGIPSNMAKPDPNAFAEVDKAVAAFASGTQPDAATWAEWTTDEKLRFLNTLGRKQSADRLQSLDSAFNLSRATNSEVRFAFLSLAVANRYDPAIPGLEAFLTDQGRRKFVRPLLTALAKDSQWGLPIAKRIYPKVRPLYHPVTVRDLDELGLISPAPNKSS